MMGTINIRIRIRLNQDVDADAAREFIENLDYEIKDTTGTVSIAETEIMEDDIED